ncbi:MAG: metal-dependent hydrolase [Novosphingobium sp.]|nr:metal-dependent hydrolase [Novosphingobium sp.]MCP5404477.1 metal-dependent hydrolase [Novosphingobium sp.]
MDVKERPDGEIADIERPLVAGKPTSTPEELALIVRDERFCRDKQPARWWLNGDPVATAWYNSVSASLPRGEAFFIDTLKNFRDDIPAKYADDVKSFVKQEINHTREHLAFNRLTEDHGYDVASIDKGITEMLALAEGRPREVNLAVAIALEHFAATIGHRLLTDPRYLEGADPDVADLWRWHATEEIEHKGLVFDIWLHVTRDWSDFKRWKTRALVALLITRKYFGNRIRDALDLMAQDGITGWRGKWKLYSFLWLKPGMMRRMFLEWAHILMPGFHPWKLDNKYLIERYRAQPGAVLEPAE